MNRVRLESSDPVKRVTVSNEMAPLAGAIHLYQVTGDEPFEAAMGSAGSY
ncbi:MAG TPA: hypothetical protein VF773_03680 [Verrucomicrobiae bacterium]